MSRISQSTLAAALAAFCAAPLAAFAQSSGDAAAPSHPSMFQHLLKKMDTDGDGKISSAEFQAAASARFDAIDTQHTGKITAQQIADAGHGKRSEEFAEREVNKIGSNDTVTRDQYLAAAQAHFAKLDKNGDGYITADEVPAGRWAQRKSPGTTAR